MSGSGEGDPLVVAVPGGTIRDVTAMETHEDDPQPGVSQQLAEVGRWRNPEAMLDALIDDLAELAERDPDGIADEIRGLIRGIRITKEASG